MNMLRMSLLASMLLLQAPFVVASEDAPAGDAALIRAVLASVEAKWLSTADPDDRTWYGSSQSAEFRKYLTDASVNSVSCFRQRTGDHTGADIRQFEDLLTGFQSVFELADWEDRLTASIDTRFGEGASATRSACRSENPASRECVVGRSFRVVGFELYVHFASCLLETWQAASERAASAP
jgi:hypothetical protein